MKSANALPIPEKELLRFQEQVARTIMMTTKWRPGRRFVAQVKKEISPDEERIVDTNPAQPVQEVILGNTAMRVGEDQTLFNEDGLHLLHVLRRGMSAGMYVSEQYQKAVGLDELLKVQNGGLTPDRQTERQQKNQTAAAIQLFAAASYGLWHLARYKPDEVGAVPMELGAVPEISILQPPEAYQCFVFYLAKLLELKRADQTRLVQSGPAAVKMTLLYLQWVIDEIRLKLPALRYAEPFTAATYKLETEDFMVNGFETVVQDVQTTAVVNPVKFEEIVGNRAAKHNALRSIHRLALFDLKVKKNPYIVAFGKVPLITMGKGIAGTGKTMMAGGEFTELSRIGDNLGFKPLYWELPKDMASEFQGKSAKQMVEWTRRFSDTSRIIYGVMDDVEGVLKSIEGNRSAESTEGIISVFLTFSEGATASRELNWLLRLLTNLPEKIYQPVMNRIQDKYDIEGAVTVEDFLDQDWIWRKDIAKQDPAFDDMEDPTINGVRYVYMGTQGQLVNLSALYAKEPIEPREGMLRKIFEDVRKTFREDEHMFYAQVYAKLKQAFPKLFSSRDVRNIQVAVNARRIDFDVDPQWLEKREAFTDKPFDEKVSMLLARQKEALQGLSMKSCRLQETVRYLNAWISIPEDARQREVNELRDGLIKQFDARQEAKKLLVSTGRVKTATEAEAL